VVVYGWFRPQVEPATRGDGGGGGGGDKVPVHG